MLHVAGWHMYTYLTNVRQLLQFMIPCEVMNLALQHCAGWPCNTVMNLALQHCDELGPATL
jgi:hypothetical protein